MHVDLVYVPRARDIRIGGLRVISDDYVELVVLDLGNTQQAQVAREAVHKDRLWVGWIDEV